MGSFVGDVENGKVDVLPEGEWLGSFEGNSLGLNDGRTVGQCVGEFIGLNVIVGTLELGRLVG